MSFKDNLLKKIEIEALIFRVINSVGAPDSGMKIDRKAMLELLGMTDFTAQKRRDLDLYVRPSGDKENDILVLDNELALYRSTIDDVVLRKSPTLKEMISIRNAIKILNDKDVVLSKRKDTVLRIKDELIGALDLSYTSADVADIVKEGVASFENGYGDGVVECLLLLGVMLGYQNAPKRLSLKHYAISGELDRNVAGKIIFGPAVAYSRAHNTLRWIPRHINLANKSQVDEFREEILSDASSEKMGKEVLSHMGSLVQPDGVVSN
jgi:hypothetical protein